MNTGKYKLKNFFTNQNLEQIIVPEIQRDYVWKQDNVEHLLASINEGAQQKKTIDPSELEKLSPEMQEMISSKLQDEEIKALTNIGFLYAYNEPKYANNYFLIDGQQRVTTIFLLLLALAIKEDRVNDFRNTYFLNERPVVDFKVRESSQMFLKQFITYLLDSGSREGKVIKDQYWYFSDYDNDATIQNLINNYNVIQTAIAKQYTHITFDYVENYLEFWYFDTNNSKQGEELYIYLNSRGAQVEENEKIKAKLLEGKSENEKSTYGRKWEEWQDFFWKNREEGQNADAGLNQFLKWVKIISYLEKEKDKQPQQKAYFVRDIFNKENITYNYLNLERIEKFYHAIVLLKKYLPLKYFESNWLQGGIFWASTYIRLLPLLRFAETYPDADERLLLRFARFFYNIVRFDVISKNPYRYTVRAMQLTEDFIQSGYSDVANLRHFSGNEDYAPIITNEEAFKLSLFAAQETEDERQAVEDEFWQAEDYRLFNGKIAFLFEAMELPMHNDSIGNFSIERFKIKAKAIYALFGKDFKPDDLLRRALLTKGDFSIWDGITPKLGGQRWSFLITEEKWRYLLNTNPRKQYLKQLVNDFNSRNTQETTRNQILHEIIDEYVTNAALQDWKFYFIKFPDIFDYCNRKNVCFLESYYIRFDDVVLLEGIKATDNMIYNLEDFIDDNL